MQEETYEMTVLEVFWADGLISDVLRVVKSGKETTVYCCQGGPALGAELAAAKVYRQFRILRTRAFTAKAA
jgi:RIO kinase 1